MSNWSSPGGFGGALGGVYDRGGARGGGSPFSPAPGGGSVLTAPNRNPFGNDMGQRQRNNPGLGGTLPPPPGVGKNFDSGFRGGNPQPEGPLPGLGGEGYAGETYYVPNGGNSGRYSLSEVAQGLLGQSAAQNRIDYSLNQLMGGAQSQLRGLNEQELRDNYANSLASLGLKSQGYDLDRQSNALKRAGLGIDRRENESERDYIARLRGVAAQMFNSDSNRISFEGQDKARGIKSDYTTAGTLFAPGHRYDQGANYLRTLNDLEQRRFAYDKELAGFDRQEQGTRFDDERIGLSEQDLGIADQRIGLMASQLGIDKNQLAQNLSRGLEALGIQGQIDAWEVVAKAIGLEAEYGQMAQMSMQDAQTLLSQMLALGTQPGDLYRSFDPSLPTYPTG